MLSDPDMSLWRANLQPVSEFLIYYRCVSIGNDEGARMSMAEVGNSEELIGVKKEPKRRSSYSKPRITKYHDLSFAALKKKGWHKSELTTSGDNDDLLIP